MFATVDTTSAFLSNKLSEQTFVFEIQLFLEEIFKFQGLKDFAA